jgi:hypothetical protein
MAHLRCSGLGSWTWSRSYEYDPRTGEWIEVSEAPPAPIPDQNPSAGSGEQPADRSPPPPVRRRAAPASGPFGGLFGMMGSLGGMGGGGDFEVEPPDSLDDFDDVGGMEG